MKIVDKFCEWWSPPKRTVYIGDALLDCSVFTQLQIRVNRLEEAVGALKQDGGYTPSCDIPKTHQ